jgi:hypothetical protein
MNGAGHCVPMTRMSDPSVVMQLIIEGPDVGAISTGHANAVVRLDCRTMPIAMATGVVENFAMFPSSRQRSSTPSHAKPSWGLNTYCVHHTLLLYHGICRSNVAIATLDDALLAWTGRPYLQLHHSCIYASPTGDQTSPLLAAPQPCPRDGPALNVKAIRIELSGLDAPWYTLDYSCAVGRFNDTYFGALPRVEEGQWCGLQAGAASTEWITTFAVHLRKRWT